MAISWKQYKARRGIDIDIWIDRNGIKTLSDVKEKLKALGMKYPSDDADFRDVLKKRQPVRQPKRKKIAPIVPARMPGENSESIEQKDEDASEKD